MVEGITPYLIFRASKERKIKKNEELTVYLPLDNVKIFDENNNSLVAREVTYPNMATAKVSTLKDGRRVVNINKGEKLVYDNLRVEDGEYKFLLKQDKVEVVFDKKTAKHITEGPKVKQPLFKKKNAVIKEETKLVDPNSIITVAPKGQCLTVSCYDEEPQVDVNYVYAQIKGFDEYVTLAVKNNFSVYKMPKFKVVVLSDGFELLPIKD